MVSVILCSNARALSAASRRSMSLMRISPARTSCTLRHVSRTSDGSCPGARSALPDHELGQMRQERNDVMLRHRLDLVDRATSNVAAEPFSQMTLGGLLGDDRARHRPMPHAPRSRTRSGSASLGSRLLSFRARITGDHSVSWVWPDDASQAGCSRNSGREDRCAVRCQALSEASAGIN